MAETYARRLVVAVGTDHLLDEHLLSMQHLRDRQHRERRALRPAPGPLLPRPHRGDGDGEGWGRRDREAAGAKGGDGDGSGGEDGRWWEYQSAVRIIDETRALRLPGCPSTDLKYMYSLYIQCT